MSVLVRAGERLRLEISNWELSITEAPMTHWYGQKVGTDTYHHGSGRLLTGRACTNDHAAIVRAWETPETQQ